MSDIQPGTARPKNNVRATRILAGAIVTGALAFAVLSLLLNIIVGPFSPELKKYENIFLDIVIGTGLICLVFARVKYGEGTVVLKDSLISLPHKLNQYRATLILYAALCEGPANK